MEFVVIAGMTGKGLSHFHLPPLSGWRVSALRVKRSVATIDVKEWTGGECVSVCRSGCWLWLKTLTRIFPFAVSPLIPVLMLQVFLKEEEFHRESVFKRFVRCMDFCVLPNSCSASPAVLFLLSCCSLTRPRCQRVVSEEQLSVKQRISANIPSCNLIHP
jgi:hypothetical protein